MADETEQQQKTNVFGMANMGYVNNSSFMTLRLDTSALLGDIERFLRSQEKKIKEDDKGQLFEVEVEVGKPLANPEGIMRICNIIRMRINHHIAQGNFKDEHYWEFIMRSRKEVTETIIKKCYDWEIQDQNLNMIIDEICALIEAFLTRPVDNKERDSYGQSFVSREQVTQNERKSALSGFSGGLGK